jgi:predicted small integral membrane protein
MITIYCGLYFISNTTDVVINNEVPDQTQTGVSLSNNTELFFFVLIVAANACFFLYWIARVAQDFKNKFRVRLESLYLLVCLCSDKQKLEKEKIRQRI